jgi:DNA-binding NarL/FixJ family response regulator
MEVVVCNESEHRRESIARLLRRVVGVCVVDLPGHSGHTAAELAPHKPDLVVMDIVRSGRPRPALVQRMREAWPNAAIVVFTAHVHPGLRACCTEAGVLCCLHESHGISRLLQIVSHRAGETVPSDSPLGERRRAECKQGNDSAALRCPAESRNTPYSGFGHRVTMATIQRRK